jgi:hypothetical protein
VESRPGEEVLVQEKLDGSCVAIAKVRGEVLALGREGFRATESQNPGRLRFAAWVVEHTSRLSALLEEGEWIVGEWLALVHSTHYRLEHEPFVAFDLFHDGAQATFDTLRGRVSGALALPHLVHRGSPLAVDAAMEALGAHGQHGAIERVEGAVWRIEKAGTVVSMAKFVRKDKVDGAFLPENSGKPAEWNES